MARKDAQPGLKEAAAERRVRALELRKAGIGYRTIGAQLGVSEAQAHRDVQSALSALRELELAEADDLRRLELERLDDAMLAIYPQVKRGNHGAIDRLLRIMERRAKLTGIDAPARFKDETDPIDWDAVPPELRDAFIAHKASIDDVRRLTK